MGKAISSKGTKISVGTLNPVPDDMLALANDETVTGSFSVAAGQIIALSADGDEATASYALW